MADTAANIEATYGHPGDKRDALIDRIEGERISEFSEIQDGWLDLIWTLDQYRVAGVMDMLSYVGFKNLLIGAALFLAIKTLVGLA